MTRIEMQALDTNDLALAAKGDRVATDILLARFEKGVDSPERRQLVAFVARTRGFGQRNLRSDDFTQEMRIRTWEAIAKWNPESAAFLTFLQGSAWLNVSHFLRTEQDYAARHVAPALGERRVEGRPSPAEVAAAERWKELTDDAAEEEMNTEMNELLLDVRTILILGLVKNPDQRKGVRHLTVALSHLVEGEEVGEFAATLDEQRERVTTATGRALHPGAVTRSHASRWLSEARGEMAQAAHQLGLDEGLVRVALKVPDDDAWQRVRVEAGLAGIVVEGVEGRAA
jgi:DNA-directed RNA polymerase specialized sigma24 family protein